MNGSFERVMRRLATAQRTLAKLAVAAVFLAALGSLASCLGLNQALLYGVEIDPVLIRPNGSGIAADTQIRYALGRRAYVTISVVGADGGKHVLRDSILRAPDHYAARFDGSVLAGNGQDRRVLPDGTYIIQVAATDLDGASAELSTQLTIQDADTSPLTISDFVIRPTTLTPNNDGEEDEASMSYSLSKKAEVTVFATDAAGNFSLIQPPKEQEGAAGLPAPWDGKENGGRVLPDGEYTIHVKAVDKAGNTSEAAEKMTIDNGGTPRMSISKVKFWPPIVPVNGTLHVEITVKNIGDTVIKSLGPEPGTEYTLRTSYASFRDEKDTPLYYEQPGRWRVGVNWNNAPQPYPIRWGFGKVLDPAKPDQKGLRPGEEFTVIGDLKIDVQLPRTGTFFWAGIEQGGVGFHDTNKGQTEIRIAY